MVPCGKKRCVNVAVTVRRAEGDVARLDGGPEALALPQERHRTEISLRRRQVELLKNLKNDSEARQHFCRL